MGHKLAGFAALVILTVLMLSACRPKSSTSPVVIYVPNPFAATATLLPTVPLPTRLPSKATLTPSPLPTIAPSLVPTATLTPLPGPPLGCPDEHGQVEKIVVQDPNLSEPMDVNIYLPPCYSNTYSGGYPVLYLIHGQIIAYEQWLRIGVPETADIYFSSGKLKPYMIVMPHEKLINQDMAASDFGTDMINGIIPWIDSHYHTCSQRSCRAIGGISRGALWALDLGFYHWQMFGAIGGHSLPGAPFSDSVALSYFKAMQPQGGLHLYLDIGDNDDFLPDAEVFVRDLDKDHIPYDWHLNPGAHNEYYWQVHVPEYLAWYGQNLTH
jgi:enterochelin esterase-like enzyme